MLFLLTGANGLHYLAGLSTDYFVAILNSLTFVWFRLALLPDLGRELPNKLPISPCNRDGVLLHFHGDPLRNLHLDGMGVSKGQLQF